MIGEVGAGSVGKVVGEAVGGQMVWVQAVGEAMVERGGRGRQWKGSGRWLGAVVVPALSWSYDSCLPLHCLILQSRTRGFFPHVKCG